MKDEEIQVSERVLVIGDLSFIGQVALPLSEMVADLATNYPDSPNDAESLPPRTARYRAHLSDLGGLAGIFLFVGGWATTKVLDEFFDIKLRPILHTAIIKVFSSRRTSKKYGLSYAIHNREKRVTILIAAIGKSLQELETSEALVKPTLAMAIANAEQTATAGVHVYLIDNGRCNAAPIIHADISAALEGLRGMVPARLPKIVRHSR